MRVRVSGNPASKWTANTTKAIGDLQTIANQLFSRNPNYSMRDFVAEVGLGRGGGWHDGAQAIADMFPKELTGTALHTALLTALAKASETTTELAKGGMRLMGTSERDGVIDPLEKMQIERKSPIAGEVLNTIVGSFGSGERFDQHRIDQFELGGEPQFHAKEHGELMFRLEGFRVLDPDFTELMEMVLAMKTRPSNGPTFRDGLDY